LGFELKEGERERERERAGRRRETWKDLKGGAWKKKRILFSQRNDLWRRK
jgi:hypothetical protein